MAQSHRKRNTILFPFKCETPAKLGYHEAATARDGATSPTTEWSLCGFGRAAVRLEELGESYFVTHIAVDGQDNLYAVVGKDEEPGRVMTQDSHREWEVCMPPGTGIGQAERPICLALDPKAVGVLVGTSLGDGLESQHVERLESAV